VLALGVAGAPARPSPTPNAGARGRPGVRGEASPSVDAIMDRGRGARIGRGARAAAAVAECLRHIQMDALVFSADAGLRLETRPIPTPGPGDLLLRVRRAGVCATDVEITRGYLRGFDGVLGHEAVAEVVGVGSGVDADDWLGARVCPELNCPPAGAAAPTPDPGAAFRNHCPNRTVLGIIGMDGVFAEYAAAPAAGCVRVPAGLSDAAAAFAEPLAAALRVVEQGLVLAGTAAAVVGDGRLGLLLAGVLAAEGALAVHFGRHADRLALVPGAHARALVPRHMDDAAAWATAQGHAGAFDLVCEASGSPSGAALALALARPLGTIVLKTTVAPGAADAPHWAAVANDVVVNEKRIVGSRCGPLDCALAALAANRGGLRDLALSMVSLRLPLRDGVAALAAAAGREALKVQLVMVADGEEGGEGRVADRARR